MRSRFERGIMSSLLILSPLILAGISNAQQKTPVPFGAALEASQTAANDLYGSRFRSAKTAAEKTTLATEMIEAALKLKDGSADQYVLLKIARQIASGAGDAASALQAADIVAERYDVPGAKLKAETFLEAARKATTTTQHKAIAEAALQVASSLADADEIELATSVCEAGRGAAQKSRQGALVKEFAAKASELKKQQASSEKYRQALAILAKEPKDPAANLAAGRYLCLVKGDWERGLAMLSQGSDEEYKAAAAKDQGGAQTAEAQAAIGDTWWDLAAAKQGDEREALQLRAGFWYKQAEPSLAGGLAGLKLKQRLEDVAKLNREVAPPSGKPAASGGAASGNISLDERAAKQRQADCAKRLKLPVVKTNSIGMKFALIPPGEFDMGSTAEEVAKLMEEGKKQNLPSWYLAKVPAEAPQHRVKITKPFYLGMFEITQTDYERITGSNPSKFKSNSNCPVDSVTWEEASVFCRKLGDLPAERAARAAYRLPSEAEWEYACRAGCTGRFSFGDSELAFTSYAWFAGNSSGTTHPVGQKLPNSWGLYDLHGNVWQWCADSHGSYTADVAVDPLVSNSGSERICRCGCWTHEAGLCRSATRYWLPADFRGNHVGFRIVLKVSSH